MNMTFTSIDYTAPTVNLNGTSKDALIEQQKAIMAASENLIAVLRQASPHGRDYQISKPGDFEKARVEWTEMMMAAVRINDYALAIGMKIMGQ